MKAVKNTVWTSHQTPNDITLNRLIAKAIEKGRINPIPKSHEPIRIKQ